MAWHQRSTAMGSRRRRGTFRSALLGTALSGAVALAASQGLAEEEKEPTPLPNRIDTDILLGHGAEPDWFDDRLQPWFEDHIELSLKEGVSYRKAFKLRGQELKLKLWGPVMKMKPGVGLRLRGLRIGDMPVEIRAFGTRKKQGIQVDLRF